MLNTDYAVRDRVGKCSFYVLLWKRDSTSLQVFDDYWRDVHGPVCSRLPAQYQYWQFHVARARTEWPGLGDIYVGCQDQECFDGIAELTFETEQERHTWFDASSILMDDERNIFSKAIGYTTASGNSKTYIDRIPVGDPNGHLGVLKYHVLVRKAHSTSVEAFHNYLSNYFAPAVVAANQVLKLRLHLFDEVDNSRPDAEGVSHYEPSEQQYEASFEIAFASHLDMAAFFSSKEYQNAVRAMPQYIRQINPFLERNAYTFVYEGQMTLAGQRSSTVAELISTLQAENQLQPNVSALMTGQKSKSKSSLGHYLNGVQHVGITVEDMQKSLEFYIDVLGGKLAVGGESFSGEELHNTLFQKEDLDAFKLGIDPKLLGVPNLRDGSQQALDVNFISFGSACVELIYYRDASSRPSGAEPFSSANPSSTSYINSSHLSFHVKDDVDLNVFAKILEEECQLRGMEKVRCNRIVHVDSEEQRRRVALPFNANKFWNEQEQSELFGSFYGWALFYCKGPNGEQLEFNQVTRKMKGKFITAQQHYIEANNPEWKINF
jgi:catechol 2,3-dioxygenase-like lactoylglutathione lyase family enzyme